MSVTVVLALAALVYLLVLFLDRVPWVTEPAKKNISGVVALITIVAVIIWAIMVRF